MRIGINVPERVRNQIKKLDPDVNVSKMCCQALEDYCAVLERARARFEADDLGELDELVAQLSEAHLDEPDWVGFALDDARDWVHVVSSHYWEKSFRYYDSLKSTGKDVAELRRVSPFPFEWWHTFSERRFDKKNAEWLDQQYVVNSDVTSFSKAEDKYSRAWLGYVYEVRRKQLQYIAERDKRRMAERGKAGAARPEPELPPQLRY